MLASFAAWLVAYRMEWLLPLRTVPFRNSQYLTVVWLPFVIAHLFSALRGRGLAVALAAGLLVVLLVVDRGTAWVLPMVLPAMLVLALDAWGPRLGFTPAATGRHRGGFARIAPIVAIAAMVGLLAMAIDVVFNGGATAWMPPDWTRAAAWRRSSTKQHGGCATLASRSSCSRWLQSRRHGSSHLVAASSSLVAPPPWR